MSLYGDKFKIGGSLALNGFRLLGDGALLLRNGGLLGLDGAGLLRNGLLELAHLGLVPGHVPQVLRAYLEDHSVALGGGAVLDVLHREAVARGQDALP